MKKTLFATAFAVAAMVSAPAFAQVTGYGDVSYSRVSIEASSVEANADAMTLNGAVNAPISGPLSIQGALNYSDSNQGDGAFTGTAHLVGSANEQIRVGAFVSASEVADETGIAGGVEGQYAFNRVTLAGAVSYATVDSLNVDMWGIDGEARLFATDDFRIDGTLGWASIDAGGGDAEMWTTGIGAEARIAGPVSLFTSYAHVSVDDADLSGDLFTIGLRYNFGGSLKDRDRSGANFVGARGLLQTAPF